MRTLRVLALLATLSTATAAQAGPGRPACRFVTDPSGDVAVASAAPYADPRIDLVSADLGTDRTRLTAVVRVVDLDAAGPTPTGLHWHVEFSLDGTEYHVAAERLADGDRFVVRRLVVVNPGDADVVNATELQVVANAEGVFDPVADEVRITVPLSAFAGHTVRRGTRLSDVQAYAAFSPGSTKDGHPVETVVEDQARASRPYVVGTATCVRVGR